MTGFDFLIYELYKTENFSSLTEKEFKEQKQSVNDNTPLKDHFDSIDIIGLAISIEDRFKCDIPDDTVDSWKTFGDVAAYYDKMQGEIPNIT